MAQLQETPWSSAEQSVPTTVPSPASDATQSCIPTPAPQQHAIRCKVLHTWCLAHMSVNLHLLQATKCCYIHSPLPAGLNPILTTVTISAHREVCAGEAGCVRLDDDLGVLVLDVHLCAPSQSFRTEAWAQRAHACCRRPPDRQQWHGMRMKMQRFLPRQQAARYKRTCSGTSTSRNSGGAWSRLPVASACMLASRRRMLRHQLYGIT